MNSQSVPHFTNSYKKSVTSNATCDFFFQLIYFCITASAVFHRKKLQAKVMRWPRISR